MFARLLACLTGLLLSAGTALAQQEYETLSFKVQEERSTALAWGIGTIFVIGCLVVAFKPAKRSNLR